ncbi:uracil-DNA glycosylase [Salinibacter grassmerensis]|uniref:uracil-DNA glycosylase n=1 Tax=Salinibacter grassmerensis TaxID=3040353 RepID=UPI0021E86466|nr:uracil-DNA glycosylase [Salinibacter grassmerensis]
MLPAVWDLFETHVFPASSTEERFNPYRNRRDDLDVPDAPTHRRDNLRAYLSCFDTAPPLFLLLEAPGPWGCRFSGVPVTSESQLTDPDFPIGGTATSQKDVPITEYSASIFWRVLQPVFPHFFVWNSLPLHPHDPDDPLSIRTPRRSEVRDWHEPLRALLDVLAPERTVGVGRKGERALDEIGAEPTYVRHPSQGGANKFEAGIEDIVDEMDLSR